MAVHDVRLGEVKEGDNVVVLGGGAIGMLIAMVAKDAGANVLVSELNPYRIALAKSLGFSAVNPTETDLVATVNEMTNGAGADVVFEVSGSAVAAKQMTDLVKTRGLVVVVAIFGKAPEIDLFRFFWREIDLIGARTYEISDFDAAIALLAEGIGAEALITDARPLSEMEAAFKALTEMPNSMKTLIQISAEQA